MTRTTAHILSPDDRKIVAALALAAEDLRYQVSAEAEGQTAASAAFVPKEGQGRIILRFAGTRPSE
jgi:hypothetical protein